jgi:hypothetical protein
MKKKIIGKRKDQSKDCMVVIYMNISEMQRSPL